MKTIAQKRIDINLAKRIAKRLRAKLGDHSGWRAYAACELRWSYRRQDGTPRKTVTIYGDAKGWKLTVQIAPGYYIVQDMRSGGYLSALPVREPHGRHGPDPHAACSRSPNGA